MYLDLNPGLQRAMFGNLGKTYTAPLVPLLEPAIARMQDMRSEERRVGKECPV